MNDLLTLSELIFPDVKDTIDDLEKKYPNRNLKSGALVTRFAPSPTGFLHTGSLFTAMIGNKLAKQSGGVFYIRLEDTDTKREIEGSGSELLTQLKTFSIIPNEGFLGDHESGNYGPYKQSDRASIYRTVIKYMITNKLAYPCFCSPNELEETRRVQEENKELPGYYGKYAKCSFLSSKEAIDRIKKGEKYVIRFRSSGNHENKIIAHDIIRGNIEIQENDTDIVILKSDGLPTYHFAHVCDDHFMRTTTVTRGEEWISSLPIHLQIFEALKWTAPNYAHLPVIMKLDNGNKRKLSKRKDNEAACSYFINDGYPSEALLTYLMSIANSNFEEWSTKQQSFLIDDFEFSLEKMSLDGALFDLDKLKYFSKEILARKSAKQISKEALVWSSQYCPELFAKISSDMHYFEEIMNIEREKDNPRKDYAKYSDILPNIGFFYDDVYSSLISLPLPWNPFISKEVIKDVLFDISKSMDYSLSEDTWFSIIKEVGLRHQFAESSKIYKANKEGYLGHSGDVAEMLRIALTGSKNSPNLYYVIKVLGKHKVDARIKSIIDNNLFK